MVLDDVSYVSVVAYVIEEMMITLPLSNVEVVVAFRLHASCLRHLDV
jgi:hypothetical protein